MNIRITIYTRSNGSAVVEFPSGASRRFDGGLQQALDWLGEDLCRSIVVIYT